MMICIAFENEAMRLVSAFTQPMVESPASISVGRCMAMVTRLTFLTVGFPLSTASSITKPPGKVWNVTSLLHSGMTDMAANRPELGLSALARPAQKRHIVTGEASCQLVGC